jgi:hypothetical protein
VDLIKEIGAFAGLVAFLGLAVLALLSFAQGRDIRRLREWAGSAPERDAERKEATSAAAQERAREMRELEEAREAERRAADLREQRRERREAGLPEMSRGERLRERLSGGGAAFDGGGVAARLGQPRYLAAIFVVLAAVVGGVAYATLHGSGGEGGGGKRAKRASHAVKASEIEVSVLNGTAVPGLAATFGDRVEKHGFKLGAVTNSSSSFAASVVMFEQGRGREAHRVSAALEIPRVRRMTADISSVAAAAPVAVVIGEDNASSTG